LAAIVFAAVTESAGAGDEEYGEIRLLGALEANRSRSGGRSAPSFWSS
jgi:hypothetical protein